MKYSSKDQILFSLLIAKLRIWAHEQGYGLTFGDAYRDHRAFGEFGIEAKSYGEKSSFHKIRLAVDFNLYINGKYMTETDDYKPLGDYWKSLHPDCTWGGDFKDKNGNRFDGNHFSFKERGR